MSNASILIRIKNLCIALLNKQKISPPSNFPLTVSLKPKCDSCIHTELSELQEKYLWVIAHILRVRICTYFKRK